MKNRDKYAKELIDFALNGIKVAIDKPTNKPVSCMDIKCEACKCYNKDCYAY